MISRSLSRILRKSDFFFNFSSKSLKETQEKAIAEKLKQLLKATYVEVIDTSNSGCGEMYKMTVESPIFKGKTKLEQHRLVNEILSEEIKKMHGLTLKTRESA